MAAAVEVSALINGHVKAPSATTPTQEKVEVVSPVKEEPENTISKEAQKEITEKAGKGVDKISAKVPLNKEELEEQSEETTGTEEEEVNMQDVATEDVASKEEEGVPIEKPIREEAPGEGGSNEPAAPPEAITTADEQASPANSTTEVASAEPTTEDIQETETTKPVEEVARDAHAAAGTTMRTA